MSTENDLIKKLMVSKAIMDKHKQIPRSGNGGVITEEYDEPRNINVPQVESFDPVSANYNSPDGVMLTSESKPITYQQPTEDRIINSKLPDDIKRLMLENPIIQPSMTGPSLSNDLVEKAARLMNKDAGGNTLTQPSQRQIVRESVPETGNLRGMLKEVLTEILKENGIIAESTTKSNETFSFKVGKHLFEGKVLKVKKLN
jgi:hypothetical protein